MKMPRLVIHEQLVKQLIKGNAEARPFSEFERVVRQRFLAGAVKQLRRLSQLGSSYF